MRHFPGATVSGSVGQKFRIDQRDGVSQEWQSAAEVTLTAPNLYWVDFSNLTNALRVYRAILVQ